MGLSRNKVAVSEGAAGSPPFYGDHDRFSRICRSRRMTRAFRQWTCEYGTFVVQFSGIRTIFESGSTRKRGCSSAGRAPALQAGGHGFEPHHLHQSSRTASREVLSPLQSLTSVFGMGTGGPSAFRALTIFLKNHSIPEN